MSQTSHARSEVNISSRNGSSLSNCCYFFSKLFSQHLSLSIKDLSSVSARTLTSFSINYCLVIRIVLKCNHTLWPLAPAQDCVTSRDPISELHGLRVLIGPTGPEVLQEPHHCPQGQDLWGDTTDMSSEVKYIKGILDVRRCLRMKVIWLSTM